MQVHRKSNIATQWKRWDYVEYISLSSEKNYLETKVLETYVGIH